MSARIRLIAIGKNGEIPDEIIPDDHLKMLVEMTVGHYERAGFPEPWVGYLALEDADPVGVCGFKSAPVQGRVEIAYDTLPGNEGRGIASAMAAELVRIAQVKDEKLVVFAQTLPAMSASTSILTKLGFTMAGCVEHPEDGTVWEWELR